eukprot:COSAG02_NODE_3072_length_7424_cov_3.895427_3_plen_66_part_00
MWMVVVVVVLGVVLGVAEVAQAQVDVNGFSPAATGRCISGHNQGGSCEYRLFVVVVQTVFLGSPC